MSEEQELVREFLIESRDNLDQLDIELVALEEDPTSKARLSSVFRTIHTIKGTSGFFAFKKLEAVAHVGETLLSRLRDGVIRLDANRTTGLLAMVDAIRTLLLEVERTGGEGAGHYGAVIEALSLLADDTTAAKGHALLAEAGVGRRISQAPRQRDSIQPTPPRVEATAVHAAAQPAAQVAPRPLVEEPRAAADSRIRVDVGLLDRLMNLVGELVLARNQLVQRANGSGDASLVTACQRLNHITSELQEGVMKTRMQPIDNVWSKFPRVVRDLSLTCGKQINLEMDGKNTELDKTIIEAISDPLTHLVRNAADHGIETPEQRVAAGKRAAGSLKLRAFHEGGRVNIELADDGRGIDPERVRAKAVERGLVSPERARALSVHEATNLIFLPGFSTAEKVTNVSGRGVGMDVVRSNIERIGGSVEVESRVGHGTTIRIKIPLTLAIIPALVVTASGERFAIPQVNLVELVRFDAEQARSSIEWLHGVPVFRLRGNLLALVELSQVLRLPKTQREDFNVVVVQADDRQFGLVVDGINDTQEIVVKPLTRELKGLNVYAGATIMGDGRVALILDVMGVAERTGVAAIQQKALADASEQKPASQQERLILFRTAEGSRMALPLNSVARLEEFPRSRVERVGSHDVVQYRGEILPLICLSRAFRGPLVKSDPLQVVVHTDGSGSVGLVVDSIDDIVEDTVKARRADGRPGTLGAAVVQGRVTELLDVAVVRQTAARGR
ncbi:MAG TPA: chemotaxis protein CheW [Polyangiaceae bacterium]|nr:chemotaxis protein CheW [Polyangiaceae bacterium]